MLEPSQFTFLAFAFDIDLLMFIRGNQAYSNGDMSKAEDFYTRGLNSISITEVSRSDNKALMLCYSNRAAARMSLGRMREALSDCMMAAKIDPSFLRAQVRAAWYGSSPLMVDFSMILLHVLILNYVV